MIFTDEKIEELARFADDSFDFKELIKNKLVGFAIEALDGRLFAAGFNYINEHSDKVPEKFHNNIVEFVDCALAKDWLKIPEIGQETLSELGNIKWLPDELEAIISKDLLTMFVHIILFYAEKNKE